MKKVILLVVLMPVMAFGQIIEDFEAGNLNNWVQSPGGHWRADTSESISGKFSLHHSYDNPDSGIDRIAIPLNNLHPSSGRTRWSFIIKHGYDPSSSNNWSIFLLSDSEPGTLPPDEVPNGYAIGVNLIGYDDTLRLWKVKNGSVTTVINSRINWQTDIGITATVKIIVERDMTGDWYLSVYLPDEDPVGTGTGNDSELFSPDWFVICYNYSSTRDRLLWFDDLCIEGIFIEDNEAPEVTGCEVTGLNSVDLILDEPPSDDFFAPGNFLLNDAEIKPEYVGVINNLTYRLEFEVNFDNKTINHLIISAICDKSGNCDQNIEIEFTPVLAEPGDIIISEIMADPLPEISLPAREYIEITNRTEYSFNLKDWEISSDGQVSLFPDLILQPLEIRIICLSRDTSFFAEFRKVTGLNRFPSLTDGGRILCMSDSSGSLVHGVDYSSDWYGDELKSGGGWSLEMIDTQFPFYDEGNWRASVARKGGTPGLVNSVSCLNPDISFYGVKNVFPEDSINITVRFSETLFNIFENISSITIDDREIIALLPVDPLLREFSIKIGEPVEQGKRYELNISGDLKDFAGNKIQTGSFVFGLPEVPGPQDVLFNELLFNPLPGDHDYLELFNCSEKIIDASRLQIVSINDEAGDTSNLYPVSAEKRCIMPETYYAITSDKKRVYNRYFSTDPDYLFETGSLPAMSDNGGHLVLFNKELDWIDEVKYNKDMHFSLLSGYEGIALEKTGPGNKSADATNWHSASESSGWGTPGAPNSMFIEGPAAEDIVTLSSSRISPDNDGYEDVLAIGFNLAGIGNVVSVMIFDETGNYVKKVAENVFAGPEASLIWDGTADDGTLVNTGIYIVFITLFDDSGKTERWKKICTVIRN